MVTAARTRPVRIAPQVAVAVRAGQHRSHRWVNALMQRRSEQLNPWAGPGLPTLGRRRARYVTQGHGNPGQPDATSAGGLSTSFYRDQIGLALPVNTAGPGTVFFAGQSLRTAGYGEPNRGPFPARCGYRCATSKTADRLVSRACRSLASPREPWGLHEMEADPDGITLIFVEVPEGHRC